MLEDWLALAALLASLVAFGWAMNHVALVVLNHVNVPLDPTCLGPARCPGLLAGML